MASQIYIGSARIGENGSVTGGQPGDQKQTSNEDYAGEVSMQKFYAHKKGWIILRAKSITVANKIADAMMTACNNPNIGYNQTSRLGVVTNGTNSKTKCNADCSSLVRQCVKEASGVDAGNFNTSTEKSCLLKTGLFQDPIVYNSDTTLYNGDILVTKTKGHTAVVVFGASRVYEKNRHYYPQYIGNSKSISDALKECGETDVSYIHRSKIAKVNGIDDYHGTSEQNIKLLDLLKDGILVKN